MFIVPEASKRDLGQSLNNNCSIAPNSFSISFETQQEAEEVKQILEGLINGDLGAFIIGTVVENIEHGASIKQAIHAALNWRIKNVREDISGMVGQKRKS